MQCVRTHAAAEQEIYQLIGADAFDGFLYIKDEIMMGTEAIEDVESLLLHSNKYIMTVDEKEHPIFDSTQYDDYDDFCKVIRHLIEVHHYQKIYCLTGPRDSFQAETRLKAYQDTMKAYGLYYDASFYEYGTFWVDSAIAYAQKLCSGSVPLPEAVVCGNDVTAMALIKALTGQGIRVPEDIAVAGYDGFPFTANIDVSLTTYARNHYQLGADAVRRLYRNITGKLCEKVQRLESGFLIGNSCGCTSIPAKQIRRSSPDVTPKMWQEDVFTDDLPYALDQAETADGLLTCALSHMDTVYQAQRIEVFLQDDAGQIVRKASSCFNQAAAVSPVEPFSYQDVKAYLHNEPQSEILYLSPLHVQDRKHGLISLSFGSYDRIYDSSYLRFVSCLSVALDRLLRMRRTDDAQMQTNAADTRADTAAAEMRRIQAEMRTAPEQQWTIGLLCRKSGMAKSTLQRLYKQITGKSIFEDLIAFRIEKAKQLLSETALSLTEIASACGYTSESYFMRQFKQINGLTPSQYREQMKAKK